jgi:hypothetical protein
LDRRDKSWQNSRNELALQIVALSRHVACDNNNTSQRKVRFGLFTRLGLPKEEENCHKSGTEFSRLKVIVFKTKITRKQTSNQMSNNFCFKLARPLDVSRFGAFTWVGSHFDDFADGVRSR